MVAMGQMDVMRPMSPVQWAMMALMGRMETAADPVEMGGPAGRFASCWMSKVLISSGVEFWLQIPVGMAAPEEWAAGEVVGVRVAKGGPPAMHARLRPR